VSQRLFTAYAAAQAILIGIFCFLPSGSWLATCWQVAIGWLATGFVLARSRAPELQSKGVWYLFALGLFFNASGILVEKLLAGHLIAAPGPSLADAFWLGLYPCVTAGLAVVVYRRSADDDAGWIVASTAISTVITIGLGLVAWELVIVPQAVLEDVSVAQLMVVTAYPMGDLVLIALALRLVFSGGLSNPAFGLLFTAILCFLGADMGWVVPLRTGEPLPEAIRHVLAATSLAAFALLAAAACHRSFPDLVQISRRGPSRPTPTMLGSLAVSLLIAPTVLAVEAVLDKLYGAVGR
jgi:diguanylate cyclase